VNQFAGKGAKPQRNEKLGTVLAQYPTEIRSQRNSVARTNHGRCHFMGLILLVLLIILLLGAVPAWPYSRGWGYGPSGGLGLLVLIVLILLLLHVF